MCLSTRNKDLAPKTSVALQKVVVLAYNAAIDQAVKTLVQHGSCYPVRGEGHDYYHAFQLASAVVESLREDEPVEEAVSDEH